MQIFVSSILGYIMICQGLKNGKDIKTAAPYGAAFLMIVGLRGFQRSISEHLKHSGSRLLLRSLFPPHSLPLPRRGKDLGFGFAGSRGLVKW